MSIIHTLNVLFHQMLQTLTLGHFLTRNFLPPLLCHVSSSLYFQTQTQTLLLPEATSERLVTQKV